MNLFANTIIVSCHSSSLSSFKWHWWRWGHEGVSESNLRGCSSYKSTEEGETLQKQNAEVLVKMSKTVFVFYKIVIFCVYIYIYICTYIIRLEVYYILDICIYDYICLCMYVYVYNMCVYILLRLI